LEYSGKLNNIAGHKLLFEKLFKDNPKLQWNVTFDLDDF